MQSEPAARVLAWVEDNDLELDQKRTSNGESFNDPHAEPNPRKWQIEITMRLQDEA
jgi:hypothetical protein